MDEFVTRIAECRDSEAMARLIGPAEPAARAELESAAMEFWDKPGLDRQEASPLFLRMATAFALCQDYPRATRLATMVADQALEVGDKATLCPALGTLGVVLLASGQRVEARRVLEKVLTLAQETGDAHARARAFHNLGVLEAMEGRDNRAVTWFEGALDLARDSEDEKVARVAGRFVDLAREALASPPAEQAAPEPAASQPCPRCEGRGMVQKEDYGMVLCPRCKGSCQV